jgi:hypothetical protein
MDDCLVGLVKAGKVTKEDAFMKASDKNTFAATVGLER